MACPKCKGKMEKRTRYEWDGQRQRLIAISYWLCLECGEKVNGGDGR